jgi:metallo-beta-lactamase class B
LKRLALFLACLPLAAVAADWDAPQQPFPLYGGSYYVGPQGVSSVLLTSPAGHILIDGGTPKSPRQIAAHVRKLGFQVEDIKYILTSHEHYDHAGGIAQLQRLSGATVLTSAKAKPVLESGKADKGDPQYGGLPDVKPVAKVKAVADGDVVKLGPLAIKAHYTPGHTQGGLSWTWSASEHGKTLNLVYADSLTAFGAAGFRYSGSASYPNAKRDVEASIARVAALPCDILVTAHPDASGLFERQAKGVLADTKACKAYADAGRERLAETLAQEAQQR